MVQKVGNKRYWEQWAADVARIAQGYMERINRLIAVPGPHKTAFDDLLSGLRKNINPRRHARRGGGNAGPAPDHKAGL